MDNNAIKSEKRNNKYIEVTQCLLFCYFIYEANYARVLILYIYSAMIVCELKDREI